MLSLIFFSRLIYVVASVATVSDSVAPVVVDASLLPTRLLLLAADARPPFLPPFLPAAAFLDLDFAGFLDFPLAILLLFCRASTTLLDHMMECTRTFVDS
jgi:hypothetical protein